MRMKSRILMYLVLMDNLFSYLFILFFFFFCHFVLFIYSFSSFRLSCLLHNRLIVFVYNAYFACRIFFSFLRDNILLYSRFQFFVFLVETSFENVMMMDYNVYIVDFISSSLTINIKSHSNNI